MNLLNISFKTQQIKRKRTSSNKENLINHFSTKILGIKYKYWKLRFQFVLFQNKIYLKNFI